MCAKLQALVFDILQPLLYLVTPESPEDSANEQFFVGAQTVVSLLLTTQIKQGVSFIAASKVYTSTNYSPLNRDGSFFVFFLPGVDVSCVYMCVWVLGCFYSHISTQTFWRALTALLDSCVEIKSAPSVA